MMMVTFIIIKAQVGLGLIDIFFTNSIYLELSFSLGHLVCRVGESLKQVTFEEFKEGGIVQG
jgi:hypothetical protein